MSSISVFSKFHYAELMENLLVNISFPSAWGLLSTVQLEVWPQVRRVKITFTEPLTNCFVPKPNFLMKYIVKWIPLSIRVRSRNTQPPLEG